MPASRSREISGKRTIPFAALRFLLPDDPTVYVCAQDRGADADGEAGVPSPCVSVCRMDTPRQYCLGCLRTIDEIAGWSRMDDAGKRAVWALIEQRLETTA